MRDLVGQPAIGHFKMRDQSLAVCFVGHGGRDREQKGQQQNNFHENLVGFPGANRGPRKTGAIVVIHGGELSVHGRILSVNVHPHPLYTLEMRKIAAITLLALPAFGQDLAIVDRIKVEASEQSKVMEILRNLSDVHGPRLTWSPGFDDAVQWATGELKSYGLDKVHTEKWGPQGRPWTLEQSSVELIAPRYSELTAVPLAWSGSTNGPVTADVVLAPLSATLFREGPKKFKESWAAYQAKWTGKLRGKIVLISAAKVPAQMT